MRRIQACLIPLLTVAAIWIHCESHKELHHIASPFFFALDNLHAQNSSLQFELNAKRQEIETLTARINTLHAQLHTQTTQIQTQPVSTFTHRSFPNYTEDSGQLQLVSMQESNPWEPESIQAQTLQLRIGNSPNTDGYWQKIQEISEKHIVGRDEKTRFLQEGSKLIQKLQEAQQNLQIDLESVQFLELKANDEGIEGLITLNNAKKKIAEQTTLVAQYQRDIETLLNPYQSISPLIKMPGTLTPNVSQTTTRFSHLSIENEIVITPSQTFLVTLHFFFTDNHTDPPQLMSVTDIFNLNTMQSTSKQFFYPDYFLKDIYELIRKTWRLQGIQWNRKPTSEDLQIFLTIINHK